MSKQRYMQEDRTIDMKKGEDRIYRIVPEEYSISYASDLRLRTENVKGGLVDLVV